MIAQRYGKPSEFLAELDSHGIYGTSALALCDFDTSMIPVRTAEGVEASIEARGLGGEFEASGSETGYFSGWQAAATLARDLLGTAPGSRYHGRGSSFRANVAGLREAGF